MRPVERGPAPRAFTDYRDAAPHLKERLGRYCSYCERWIAEGLAVEHISPKSKDPANTLAWENFLLACMSCNSTKGDKPIPQDCIWPDEHDTWGAFRYHESGAVKPSPNLPAPVRDGAVNLLRLVGLDKTPKEDNSHRWDDRLEAWSKARTARELLQTVPKAAVENFRALAVKTVTGHGHWSIWMTVFAHDPAMQTALIAAFPGTAHGRMAALPFQANP